MNAPRIHPTSIVDPAAEIGEGTEIGPYCIIGPGVVLGESCWLQHHVTLCGPSRIGSRNRFYAYASIGQQTQDLKYAGEPTYLEIGDDNCFRESVTVHRGTAVGGLTRIGSRGNFLAYSHVAHDCIVGDNVIFSNNGTLAGHVEVGDFAIIGGLSAIHQFCRIGRYAMTGGCTKVVKDVPPFLLADGNPAQARFVNKVGLERHGYDRARVRHVIGLFEVLYRAGLNVSQACERIEKDFPGSPDAAEMVAFIRTSKRGIIKRGEREE